MAQLALVREVRFRGVGVRDGHGHGDGQAVMIDGKVGSPYETVLENNVAACRFVDGRTFRFYGTKAGQIYRATLDIS